MKKLGLIVMVSLLVGMTACTSAGTVTTTSSTSTTTSMTTTPGQEPVVVVSVTGPMPPINPGGPTVEIVLENASAEPVVYLTATLGVSGPPGGGGFTFNFDVTEANPLAPGSSATARMSLIGGGFSSDALYPLTVNGSFEESGPFSYTVQVYISPPEASETGS